MKINIPYISGLSVRKIRCREAKRAVCILFALAVFGYVCAVETIIVGEVVNENTGEPVPNVNIHFRGSKIGTTSDETGAYALRVDLNAKLQLVFSAVGYHSQRFEIEPGTIAGLQVALRERTTMLEEVVIAPNENPALELLRQVRERRPLNDRAQHPEIVSTNRREHKLFISHIQRRHLRRALWKSLQSGMIMQEDSTFIMPLYSESQTFRIEGATMIPANDRETRTLVLSPTDYSSLLGGEGNLNFYKNSVSLMGHAFLSPLASSGNLYYRYYIDDSKEDSLVTIVFRTRNPFYATFNGEMCIDTTNYALRAIRAYVPAEVAVNYVNNLHVSQILAPDNSIAEEHVSVLLDFSVKTDRAGSVFPTVLLTSSLTNQSHPSFPEKTMPGIPKTEGLSDSVAMARLDSLPVMRTAKWFATIATTGYIPTGTPVDIGHIEEILQINRHEGVHIGLPFRTNEKFSRVISLEASVGYGIRDRAPKGMGRISVNLPTPRRNTLRMEYQDRYVWAEVDDFDRMQRENSVGWGNFDFTAYAFEALRRDSLCVNTAMRQRQIQLHWFADWTPGLESQAFLRVGWQGGCAYQSLSLIARFSWGERKYDGFFMRRYAYSPRFPVLYLGLETGHWTATETNGELFAHLRLMLTQRAQLGMGGSLSYAFQAGAIFGATPAFLLKQFNANQGYAYDPYRFTFLHGGEMIADKYLSLQAEWNGQGILFNLVPGLRWLHLRELVEGKIAYGYLSNNHAGKDIPYTETAGGMFYAELGVGLGNILRVCDLYSVWALAPHIAWGIRFRIHLDL